MKVALAFCLALAASASHADTSFDPAKLGKMRGILDVCSKVNPSKASSYLLDMKSFIGKSTREEVNQAERSDEYRHAYQSVTDELNGMGDEDMLHACNGYFTASNAR